MIWFKILLLVLLKIKNQKKKNLMKKEENDLIEKKPDKEIQKEEIKPTQKQKKNIYNHL